MSLSAIAAAVGGELTDAPDPTVLCTAPAAFDSREVAPGGLFVALPGDQSDGHSFAQAAVKGGAVAVLAARPVGVPAIVVGDVLTAFGRLGKHVLASLTDTAVVAVTGSAGKTSTKDLLAQLLPAAGLTVATQASFNNELGLPITISRADTATRFLVLEMGARGIGHIQYLTDIAPPHISVVTNVGTAHVGEFGSRENIAQAKGEIVEALRPGGLAVLNADDPLVRAMANRTSARIALYGTAPDATVRATDITIGDDGRAQYTLTTPEGSARVHLHLVGMPQVHNSLAAAAVALDAGLSTEQIADLLSSATAQSHWRMETHTRGDGVTIVNDTYNANPDSMESSLRALEAMSRGPKQRSIAVLGRMNELGETSRAAHEQVGKIAASLGLDLIITIGGDEALWMQTAAGIMGATALHVPDQDAALALLRETLRRGDVVLIKASRGVRLEQLALALQPDPEETAVGA